MHAIADLKFQYCTAIQAAVLPHTLAGKDIAGQAQTGTGKTAAFLLAILNRLHRSSEHSAPASPRALVLAPTRELVMQIHKDAVALGKYARVQALGVYGGMDYKKQADTLRKQPVDLVVATPGRLLDYAQNGVFKFNRVEVLIIDEADRMLDMGFIPDVKRIIYSLPPRERRQTLLFSATLSEDVMRLASRWMVDPVTVNITPESLTVDAIEQRVYLVAKHEKFPVLCNVLKHDAVTRMLVFRNRRDAVERLARRLHQRGIPCAELSGDVPQVRRIKILDDFRSGKVKVVIATDVAGRGIHVDAISHVVNYDVPYEAEDYVHRIGRTGRAGATGVAITLACEDGAFGLPAIEEYIGHALPYKHPEESWLKLQD